MTQDKGDTADIRAIRGIRWLAILNLGLITLQPLSAGFLLSGYERAVSVHAAVAMAAQLGVLIQALTAIIQWRRRRVPGWVAGFSVALFAIVFLQAGLGYGKRYWLHVPVGVAVLGWLRGQLSKFDALRPPAGAQP